MRTTSSWWLLSMAEVFRRQGLPVARLFSESGLPLQSLAHQQTRYPQDGVTRLWDAAEALSGNHQIGLAVGRQVSLTGFPVLAYSLITASGLVDGFQRFQRYQRMIGESANIQLCSRSGSLALDFDFKGDDIPVSVHTIDAAMAAMVNMARLLEGEDWHPGSVQLRRPEPDNPAEYADYFACDVVFRAKHNRMTIDAGSLTLSDTGHMPDNDPVWQASVAPDQKPTAELVAMLLNSKLQDGGLTKQQVADQLSMAPRTLQRRLAAERETFQGILDRVRHQKALEALANPLLSFMEVAFLCGFSDVTAFHHRFRRWQGQTPGQYRASILDTSGQRKK